MMQVVKTKLPRIEDVIQAEGIVLHDKGGYYVGLCPFHDDKDPSLVIYKGKHYFKCYGCYALGDSIGFIMKLHKKSFKEALKYLNIKDFKLKPRPKPSMIDVIAKEEAEGVDVIAKYGKEFIQTLLGKEFAKNLKGLNSNS